MWSNSGPAGGYGARLAISKSNPDVLYAGSYGGVYRSTDGGVTWPRTLGLSILSYAGQVRLGVLTDAGLVPDPEAVITGFHAEFDAMSDLAQETEERRSLKELLVGLSDTLDRLNTVLDDIAQAAQNAAGR